jgi:hypothetical protein
MHRTIVREPSGSGKRAEIGRRIEAYVTRAELLLLAGSVNEAIEAVDDCEFPTRLGASVAEATT